MSAGLKKRSRSLICSLAIALSLAGTTTLPGAPFLRGNANGDALLDLSDIPCMLSYLFRFGTSTCQFPGCVDALDANDDGAVDISDPVYLLFHFFLGGLGPPIPNSGICGSDPTPDGLTCEFYLECSPAPPCQLTKIVTMGPQTNPDMVVDHAGNSVVVWQSDRNENSLFNIRCKGFNPDGTKSFSQFSANTTSLGQQINPVVAMDGAGGFVVVWQHDGNLDFNYDIIARAFHADSLERIPEFEVNSKTSGFQENPAIAMDASGNFVVVWQANGNPLVNDLFNIKGRGFFADGTERFPEFTVNFESHGQQRDPVIAMDALGNFVVAWENDGNNDTFFDIFARGFGAAGLERIPSFQVHVGSSGNQEDPDIAMDTSGNFIVVWQHDGNKDKFYELHARGFDALGTERLVQFTANLNSRGQQWNVAVAMDAAGNIAVTYEEDRNKDKKYVVRVRGFGPDGLENFAHRRANCIEPANHRSPTVGIDGFGRIRVFWVEDPEYLGLTQIMGRTFLPDATTGQ